MKIIYFLRTAQYPYQIKGEDLYDSFDAVATRKLDLGIQKTKDQLFAKTFEDIEQIYCSPTKRSIQTAFLIGNPQVREELREVFYSMKNFISKNKFFEDGEPNVTKARKAFVSALIANELRESYTSVIRRIEQFLKQLQTTQGNSLVFSHGFFLKILEAYIRDTSIKSQPKKLLKYFSGETETFHFLEGFTVKEHNGKYIFESYIRKEQI